MHNACRHCRLTATDDRRVGPLPAKAKAAAITITMADDATYDDATYADATYVTNADEQTQVDYIRGKGHGILSILFSSCAGDPKGSVHRAWGITLLFIVLFFAMAFVEGE